MNKPQEEQMIYMLSDFDGSALGPFYGAPGLNIAALAEQYRMQQYDKAEAAEQDYCILSHDEFAAWLLETKVLSETTHVLAGYSLAQRGKDRYAPRHWPVCPQCREGRGDKMPGRHRRSLNRWVWYYQCTMCNHKWGDHDVPLDDSKPMIEDDGREIEDACVPYSLSQTTGIPMDQMLPLCTRLGWAVGYGMDVDKAMIAAREVGFYLYQVPIAKTTLSRVLRSLNPTKKYIVETNRHWLAVVNGENRDMSETSMRAFVYRYWEVLPV